MEAECGPLEAVSHRTAASHRRSLTRVVLQSDWAAEEEDSEEADILWGSIKLPVVFISHRPSMDLIYTHPTTYHPTTSGKLFVGPLGAAESGETQASRREVSAPADGWYQ